MLRLALPSWHKSKKKIMITFLLIPSNRLGQGRLFPFDLTSPQCFIAKILAKPKKIFEAVKLNHQASAAPTHSGQDVTKICQSVWQETLFVDMKTILKAN